MKFSILLSILISTFSSFSFAWEKIVNCDNGNLVIDIGENDELGRPTYQLVLKGEPLNYFVQQKAVKAEQVNNSEFVAPLSTYDNAYFTSEAITHAPPITYLRHWVFVNKYDKSVYLKANIEGRIGLGGQELANWKFYNCAIR